jgi:lipoprotein-anchoring transpeptidase ErfK/SrfK
MRTAVLERKVFLSFVTAALCGGFFILSATSVMAADDVDSDSDGLTDLVETTMHHTDPSNPDTDGDGFSDGDEVKNGFSPRFGDKKKMIDVDSDKDYLNDAWEVALGTGLFDPDSDHDLYLDGTEVAASYDPLTPSAVKREKSILVDIKTQRLSYYFGDTLFDSFLISSGVRGMETPRGEFKILDKVPSKNYGGAGFGFSYPDTKWNLHFTSSRWRYYIHGAYWHDKFGKPMSHGCVNVAYKNMERLYDWAQHGTKVVIR